MLEHLWCSLALMYLFTHIVQDGFAIWNMSKNLNPSLTSSITVSDMLHMPAKLYMINEEWMAGDQMEILLS